MKSVKVSDETAVYAEAGVSFTKLALDMCKRGLSGLEFAYGIPGSVGGAVYMNAGAYGGETKDVIKNVRVLDKNGNVLTLSNEECDFGYRKSIFHNDEYVILGAEFELVKKDAESCVAAARELMQKRVDKQPLEYPSCGSTFKRPEGYFAGALIEEANLKGYSVGGAQVSQKHAGFVINKGGATTADVLSLMREIQQTVREKSGITLEAEIKLLDKNGEFFSL
ncbi:MAG: UDP-N-acetylmuramate dehydrogenase, partial [Clostridia bacterium]|nr:UDP-N-acetylmuramate dehydrogenase [Clostridia bacterium]